MSDLRDLYQEVILDHNRSPRNYRALPEASHKADGHNPLCGDRVRVFVRLDGDTLADVTFQGEGCAISQAAASLMTEAVAGMSRQDAAALLRDFQGVVTGKPAAGAEERIGKLAVLAGVAEFPMRVKCATLAWHTLHAALADEGRPTTTE